MTSVSAQSFEDIKVEAFKICQDFLGQPWKGLSFSEFGFSEVSGGLSNSLYCCALPENTIVKNPQTPKQVLLRIYGPLQDETNIIVTEAATFTLLAERKLGPKLFGIFSNGRLEEFIPSRTCKSKDYRLIYPDIARELAKIHALEVPVRKVPDFWQKYFKKWLNEIEEETLQKYNKTFESGDKYREEYEWLTEEMRKTDSPVVYCHNDLQGGNILLRQDSSSDGDHKLMLIDFEFGAYNYR
ncbi:hypothetical protein CEXT_459341 [Caerostris extrusa]|uniref:Choline kinase n=1 Tax=Caerostris extrusa TaxID=172846 RepID=A0AAV4RJK3_CAEEX|nr:hypothetical protein CEXT_459341 [Caerostris extrusa]